MQDDMAYTGFIDLIKNTFFKKKKVKPVELTWETKDGRVLKISEMEIKHCRSVVEWMERQCAGTNIKNLWMWDALQKDVRYIALKDRIKQDQRGRKWKYLKT